MTRALQIILLSAFALALFFGIIGGFVALGSNDANGPVADCGTAGVKFVQHNSDVPMEVVVCNNGKVFEP